MEKIDKERFKKVFPTYLLLILFPSIFALLISIFIIKTDIKHEIELIKTSISQRAIDFTSKATAVDYFRPYFEKLASQLSPYIEKKPKSDGSYMTKEEAINIIGNLRKTLGENIRCFLFDENGEMVNTQELLNHEKNYFCHIWNRIHKIDKDISDEKDNSSNYGKDFYSKILGGHSELCVPTSIFGKMGVFYYKNAPNGINGIIIFVEYNRTNLELVEAKIKDFAFEDQPIILYDVSGTKRITSGKIQKEVYGYKTDSESFINGFVVENMVWKGFVSEEYKLLFGQKFYNKSRFIIRFWVSFIIFIFILTIASFIFFKNITNTKGAYISIRYKLMFIFGLAVYTPILSLWALSYIRLQDHRIALENNIKKGMLDTLNKIDNDYKKKEEIIKNSFKQLNEYLNSFSGKKLPTSKEVDQKLQEIVGKDQEVISIFTWVDIRSIDQNQVYTTSINDANERLKRIARAISLLCLEKYCPERLNHAHIIPNQSDLLVGNLLENPVLGFSAAFERPNELFVLNFEGTN